MKIHIEQINDITALRFSGKFSGEEDSELLKKTVDDLIEEGHRKFLFDLEQLHWITSTGLAVMLHVHYAIESHQGRIVFCNLVERIEAIIGITKLNSIFSIFGGEDEALSNLAR